MDLVFFNDYERIYNMHSVYLLLLIFFKDVQIFRSDFCLQTFFSVEFFLYFCSRGDRID
jgi:hypothetical protein